MLDSLIRISNFKTVSADLAVGGQAPESYFSLLRKAGFGLIVHIEVEGIGSLVQREDLVVLENEMLYEKITINYNEPNVADFIYLAQVLEQYRKLRIYVHCATGFCSSALIIPHLMIKHNYSLNEAMESVVAWNIPLKWRQAIEAAVAELAESRQSA
jgi:protein-tyrosine phosphatase